MKLVADMGVTPVGLRPPYMKPISAFRGNNRQAIHLAVADPCADKPSHLSAPEPDIDRVPLAKPFVHVALGTTHPQHMKHTIEKTTIITCRPHLEAALR